MSYVIVLFKRFTRQTRSVGSNKILIDSMSPNFIGSMGLSNTIYYWIKYNILLATNNYIIGRDINKIYLIQLYFFSRCTADGIYRTVTRVRNRIPRALWHLPFTQLHGSFYPFNVEEGSTESGDLRSVIRSSLDSVLTVNSTIIIINY